jgi:hypothetical protein
LILVEFELRSSRTAPEEQRLLLDMTIGLRFGLGVEYQLSSGTKRKGNIYHWKLVPEDW